MSPVDLCPRIGKVEEIFKLKTICSFYKDGDVCALNNEKGECKKFVSMSANVSLKSGALFGRR